MSDALTTFTESLARLMGQIDPLNIDRDKHIPSDLLTKLAELGAFGVTLPADHGGSELGLTGACRVIDTLARYDRAIATTVGLHLGLGTRGLVAFGTPAQKDRYLPRLATGQIIAAFATTEPSSGSDLTQLKTRATRTNGRLRVEGEKAYVTNGGLAGLYTLTASAIGFDSPGRVLLLAERADPGLTIGREEDKLGLRGSSTTPIHLDLDLAEDRLLGPPERGPDQLAHILAWGRTAMAAGCCGTAQSALDKTLEHVASRTQFGRTLASQPVVQDQVAFMQTRLFAMRALVDLAAAAADQAAVSLEARSLAAKIFASDGDWAICDLAIQLHGGSGYIEETGIPLLLRDARITRIFEGANDVLLTRLGQLELTRPTLHDGPAFVALRELRHHGLKVLRDPRRLHLAGRFTVLGLAHAATSSADSPLAAATHTALARELAVLTVAAAIDGSLSPNHPHPHTSQTSPTSNPTQPRHPGAPA